SCREPHNPRIRTRRRRTGSRAESPHTNRADHPRPQTRCASPSTATQDQGPTGKDRCLASPHNKLDPNRSLPMPTQKAALPTPFSEEPNSGYRARATWYGNQLNHMRDFNHLYEGAMFSYYKREYAQTVLSLLTALEGVMLSFYGYNIGSNAQKP